MLAIGPSRRMAPSRHVHMEVLVSADHKTPAAAGSPLPAALGLPEETAIAGALMVGYPRYTYRRLVDRDPLRVRWL